MGTNLDQEWEKELEEIMKDEKPMASNKGGRRSSHYTKSTLNLSKITEETKAQFDADLRELCEEQLPVPKKKKRMKGHSSTTVRRQRTDDDFDVELAAIMNDGDDSTAGPSSTVDYTLHQTVAHHESTRQNPIDEYDKELEELFEGLGMEGRHRKPTFIDASDAEWVPMRVKIGKFFCTAMYQRGFTLESRADLLLTEKCLLCCQPTTTMVDSANVISLNGMTPVTFSVSACSSCSWRSVLEPADYVQLSLWPINTRVKTFFDFEYMLYTSVLQQYSPTLSLGSMLQALSFVTSINKYVDSTFQMKQDSFNVCLDEWRRFELGYLSNSMIDPFTCPACLETPHALHIDGNAKLYRYRRAGSATMCGSDDVNLLLLDGKFVKDSVDKIASTIKGVGQSNLCGETRWKAANTSMGKTFRHKDETGCLLATCRHVLLMKGLDMYRGEIFAYPYILQQQMRNSRHIGMDTMCRYYPWLQRVDPDLASCTKPFVSVMHVKAHTWKCQVEWSGRVRSGVGLSTGETTEQANSYMSRHGVTTRHMTSAGRRRRLEQAAAFWNLRKIAKLPKLIKTSIAKCTQLISRLSSELEDKLIDLGIMEYQLAHVSNLISGQSASQNPVEQEIERLSCQSHRLRRQIYRYADSSKSRDRVKKQLNKVGEKLKTFISQYEESKGEKLDIDRLSDTLIFPWHENIQGIQLTPALLQAYETYHLLARSREELIILQGEKVNMIKHFVSRYKASNELCYNHPFLMRMVNDCRMYFSKDCEVMEDNDDDEDDDKDGFSADGECHSDSFGDDEISDNDANVEESDRD